MKSTKTSIVIAATALVVAVFGSTPLGHAAGRLVLPSNSVGTAQLKSSSVTGAKIKNGTLTAAKFKGGQLLTGSQGPKGDAGAQGHKGDTGSTGLTGYHIVSEVAQDAPPGQKITLIPLCSAGEKALGGGFAAHEPLSVQYAAPMDKQPRYIFVG